MKKQKVPEVKLPYASTVASFFADQGAVQGNSFLGRLFNGGGRNITTQTQFNPRARVQQGNVSKPPTPTGGRR